MRKRVSRKKKIESMLLDTEVPIEMRLHLTRDLATSDEDAATAAIRSVLEAAARTTAESLYEEKNAELSQLLAEMQEGPLRFATFDALATSDQLGIRARVILPDGSLAYCAVPDRTLGDRMRRGDTVWTDAQLRVVLYHEPEHHTLGDEGRIEHLLPGGELRVSLSEHQHMVCHASDQLAQQIERGEAKPGSAVVVCPRRRLAFRVLPGEELGHQRYLRNEAPPDVQVERDIGSPPPFIEKIARHVEREMQDPSVGRRHRLRPSTLLMATGVPGTGKTLCLEALWRRIYEVVSKLTGAALEDLPPRVLELDTATLLSKWLGDSDRNIARFFDEAEAVAQEPFVGPDGREWKLPVIIVCEEIEALSRRRGENDVFDRIQTTLLKRLDPRRRFFQEQIAIVVCTSNLPDAIDPAFLRRAGAIQHRFQRPGRFEFRAMLDKHLADRPFEGGDEARERALQGLTAWLFAPTSDDEAAVEIHYVGEATPVRKQRRDFLTGALVDRAVQQASAEVCDAEWAGEVNAGHDHARLMRAFDDQVHAIVDQLTPQNVSDYLTLPDGARVASVRRIPRAAVLPIELERVAS
jgi:ATP-dependent 26S proteasome regulatory subunit